MKKNIYRFAAMDVIVNAINDSIQTLKYTNQVDIDYYDGKEMPDYVKANIDKRNGIIEELENFIDKL